MNEKLSSKIDLFYKKASFANEDSFSFYFKSILNRISKNAEGSLASVNHLLSYPKYRKSQGLLLMKDFLPKIMKECKNTNADYPFSLEVLNDLIGTITFYTFSQNAGTGFDSSTTSSEDAIKPPSFFVKNIDLLFKQLKERRDEFKKDTAKKS